MGRERKHDSRRNTHHRRSDFALDIGLRGGDRFHPCVVVLVVVFLISKRRRNLVLRQVNGAGRVVAALFSRLSAVIVIDHVVALVIGPVRRPCCIELVKLFSEGSCTRVVVIANMMPLRPVRVRQAVRHGEAGRRKAGQQRQHEEGPSGPEGSGHAVRI